MWIQTFQYAFIFENIQIQICIRPLNLCHEVVVLMPGISVGLNPIYIFGYEYK